MYITVSDFSLFQRYVPTLIVLYTSYVGEIIHVNFYLSGEPNQDGTSLIKRRSTVACLLCLWSPWLL
jgi:hypothetical protein